MLTSRLTRILCFLLSILLCLEEHPGCRNRRQFTELAHPVYTARALQTALTSSSRRRRECLNCQAVAPILFFGKRRNERSTNRIAYIVRHAGSPRTLRWSCWAMASWTPPRRCASSTTCSHASCHCQVHTNHCCRVKLSAIACTAARPGVKGANVCCPVQTAAWHVEWLPARSTAAAAAVKCLNAANAANAHVSVPYAEQSQEESAAQPELPQLRRALQRRLGQRLTALQFILLRERVLWRRGWLAMPQAGRPSHAAARKKPFLYPRKATLQLHAGASRPKTVNVLLAVSMVSWVHAPYQKRCCKR
jgi:hypothetical protein